MKAPYLLLSCIVASTVFARPPVRRASSNATFTCTAYGGRHGGALSLATANFDRLAKIGGDDLPTAPAGVAPYETRTWSAEYAPLVHSGGANDIAAIATFTEALSGNVTCATAATTVVKLSLTPWVTRQGCDNRHIVGVREYIWCAAAPNVGQWGETGGGELGSVMSSMSYKCPLISDGSFLYYEVGLCHYDFDFTILEPTGLVARSSIAKDFGVATNHAGGAGMNLEIYVLPETVALPVEVTDPALAAPFTVIVFAVSPCATVADLAVNVPVTVKFPLALETLDATAANGTGSSFWRGIISPEELDTLREM